MTTCGYLKKDGNPCTVKGSNATPDGRMLCGTHYKIFLKEDQTTTAAAATDSAPRAKKAKEEDIKTIYSHIKKFIQNNDNLITLNNDEKDIVLGLESCSSREISIIINRARRKSACTKTETNYQSIANKIPDAFEGYKRATAIEKKPIKSSLEMFPVRKNSRMSSFPKNINDSMALTTRSLANNICQFYQDPGVEILNCKFVDLVEWDDNPSNIYMGPAGNGVFTDSEWFIPLRPEYKFREQQNKEDVEIIMKKIKSGEEKKEKYLNLIGKTLGCVCFPEACHCEVYVEVIKNIKAMQ